MLALRDYLNKEGDYIAVYANVEGGQASRNDVQSVIKSTVDTLAEQVRGVVKNDLPWQLRDEVQQVGKDSMLATYLRRLSENLSKPIVLVIVCGVRDVRDYRIVLSNQDIITGGSAFNIKAESLRLGNFSKEEIHELYMQHTRETSQVFDEACFPMVWEATEGQPWLVNALGREVTWSMKENRDRSVVITPEMLYRAQENLINRTNLAVKAGIPISNYGMAIAYMTGIFARVTNSVNSKF